MWCFKCLMHICAHLCTFVHICALCIVRWLLVDRTDLLQTFFRHNFHFCEVCSVSEVNEMYSHNKGINNVCVGLNTKVKLYSSKPIQVNYFLDILLHKLYNNSMIVTLVHDMQENSYSLGMSLLIQK